MVLVPHQQILLPVQILYFLLLHLLVVGKEGMLQARALYVMAAMEAPAAVGK